MPRRRRLVALVAIGVAVIALAIAVHGPLLRAAGAWLRVEDRLRKADAIVVLAGGTPRRELAAAALWREGWAPRIIISRAYQRPGVEQLIAMGVRPLDEQSEARLVLEKAGVPADRIIAIPTVSRTTEPELALVRDAARRAGYRTLILVTSPHHTRRVRLVWSRQAGGDPAGIVVSTPEHFPFEDWWRRRRAAESVAHEYAGLLVIALGISHLFE